MLGRIERLNEGLRQVSDNIAHDLKTPLTRLRNRAEAALAGEGGDAHREALEQMIADSDQLIRTFNALLMISRVEAGSSTAQMSDVDLSGLAADAAELYEPVAEEQGVKLTARIAPGVRVRGNRELLAQDGAWLGVAPVGNYAVRLTFSDSHQSGIYSWSYFLSLAAERDRLWNRYLAELEEKGLSRDSAPPQALKF